MENMKINILFVAIVMCILQTDRSIVLGAFGSGSDKVRLKDIDVLTLYNARMTTGRRSAPVSQLKCVGGSAAHSYVPQVVQCYNRGSDGSDVQWECKADMDNAYRFGQVQVSCEGYDYPDDPYILKGSCGLEYTLELTKEGYEQQNRNQHQHHGQNSYGESQGYNSYYSGKKSSNSFGDIITLAIVGVIIYGIYRTCIAGNGQNTEDNANSNRGPPPPYSARGPNPSAPPPPGFRDEYMPGSGYDDGNCHSTRSNAHTRPSTSTGGGFWSGAATGGMLGYLFGSRTNTGYSRPHNPGWGGGGWGSGWGNGWGSSSWGSPTRTIHRSSGWGSSGGGGGGGGSTGTRTASGFGGTSRR